jgi:hypothetical protein
MSSKDRPPRTAALLASTGPIVLLVSRIAVDQAAETEAMISLAGVSIFCLMAFLGHAWAVRFAPAAILIAATIVLVYAVMGTTPFYWPIVGGLVWCAYELAVGDDLKAFLLAKGERE